MRYFVTICRVILLETIIWKVRTVKLLFIIMTIVFIAAASGCSDTPVQAISNNKILEDLVLAKSKLKRDELSAIFNNKSKYTKKGHYYEPKQVEYAFGYEIKYIGLDGLDVVPGPNLTLVGSTSDIAKTISSSTDLKFENQGNNYAHKLGKYAAIGVFQHPTKSDLAIIQFGYFGP